MILSLYSQNIRELHFTGGAPHGTYQPSIIIPILTEAFRLNGIEFSSEYNPSLRSLMLSDSGEFDGELHRVFDFQDISNNKYPNLLRVDTHLVSVWQSFYTNIKGISVETIQDLSPYRVSYYRGRQNVQKLLEGIIPESQISQVSTDEQAFKMLNSGRIDIVISESRQGNSIIEKNHYSDIYEIKKIDEIRICTYLHKKHSLLVPLLNETLLEMKRNGTFDRIFNEAERAYAEKNQ
jgi:polar amino acid transport system substrate-binding protein